MEVNGKIINSTGSEDIILYKKRWFILFLFVLYSLSNLMQYYNYTVIANVIVQYYGVSHTTINWTTMVKFVTFPILCIPANYVIERIGIRKTILIATVGTSIGTCLKFASIHPDRFWIAILAQTIIFIFYIFVIPLLPKVTAIWFGSKETGIANAIGSAGIYFGVALSFLLPPMIVTKGKPDNIGRCLTTLTTIYTGFSLTTTIALFCFFSNAPTTPSSVAQIKSIKTKETLEPFGLIQIYKFILILCSNRSYGLFVIIYSVNTRMLSPIHTMLNEIILNYYPDATRDVAVIGLLLNFLSIIGSLFIGKILDNYKKFRLTIYASYTIYVLSVGLFMGLLDKGIAFVYVTAIIMGIADGFLVPSAIELCMELTYPVPENIATSLLFIADNLLSVIIVSLYTHIFESIGIFWANMNLLLMGLVNLLFFFVKFDLKRQAAQNLVGETVALISP